MEKQRNPLDLVSFAPIKVDVPFRESLVRLGHPVQTRDAEVWLKARASGAGNPQILLFDCSPYPRNAILERLKNCCRIPRLGAQADAARFMDTEILGCCDEFLTWPCPDKELLLRLRRICLHVDSKSYCRDADSVVEEFAGLNLIGRSSAFLEALHLIKKVARCDVAVLITGETGTGKELAARATHYLGARREDPFIPVNCGAIPDNLIENELFGHQTGAYTGAKRVQPGMIELADGGTLFIDDIDTLSEKAQVTLLRFLQSKEYKPLGGSRLRKVDVRIIAATNVSLEQRVQEGLFREDLLFRLNIIPVTLPPLRDRTGDIRLLADHFFNKYREEYDQLGKSLPPGLLRSMEVHPWPGNIRELDSFIHRLFFHPEGSLSLLDKEKSSARDRRKNVLDRRVSGLLEGSFRDAKSTLVAEFEKRYLCNLMVQTRGNVTLAAKIAGKERRSLGKILKKYDIDRKKYLADLPLISDPGT